LRITPVSGTVNVRAAPSATATIIGAVAPGQAVEVIEANAEGKIGNQANQQWVEIRLSDGRTGYTAAWFYRLADAVIDLVLFSMFDRAKCR
jgi:uncharacterized protein YgiM (DUF1202 family)